MTDITVEVMKTTKLPVSKITFHTLGVLTKDVSSYFLEPQTFEIARLDTGDLTHIPVFNLNTGSYQNSISLSKEAVIKLHASLERIIEGEGWSFGDPDAVKG